MTASPPEGLPEAVRDALGRELAPDEFARQLAIPLTDAERDETLALVRWFTRRYPTPAERLAYVRRAYRRWTRLRKHAAR